MPSVLYIRDKNGNFVGINALRGVPGKSAYEQAVEGGYEGSENEFNVVIANLKDLQTHITNFGNPHETTAEDVGALPIEGGKLTGEGVVLGDGTGKVSSGQNYIQLDVFDDDESYDNRRKLVLNGVRNTQLADCLVLTDVENGEQTNYVLYGTHNKPTAMDVGAVSTKGDTMIGALTIDKSTDWGQIILQSVAGHYRALETDDSRVRIDVRDDKLTTGRRYIDILSNVGETSFAKAMKFVQTKDGTTKSEYVLHTGNINDFIISKGSYTGGNGASKTIPVRKTTQMVLVYGVRENIAYTVGVLVRGVNNVHCDIGPSVANPASSEVVWEDTSVTISHYLSSPLYVWDETGVKYHYVVIG